MGERDITQKTLESYNDVFADIVNVLVFGGEQVVEADSLTDSQTFSQYKDSENVLHNQERDVAQKRKNQCRFVLWATTVWHTEVS